MSQRTVKLGLMKTYAYHCNRCDYLWFPRDYEYEHDDIMKMKPPKSCARCKSKLWRQERVYSTMRTVPRGLYEMGYRIGSVAQERAINRRVKKETKK